MPIGLIANIETDDDVGQDTREFGGGNQLIDARAHHCRTPAEYALFKFSSNYQSYHTGMDSMNKMLGLELDFFETVD